MTKLRILVCGAGGPGHVLAGLAASREDMEARVLSLTEDEAEKWSDLLQKEELTISINEGEDEPRIIKAKPKFVTKDPARAVKGAAFVILTVPANEHQTYLEAIAGHLEPDTTVVGFPGQSGFEFLCMSCLKNKAKRYTIINMDSMPYACRLKEFGKSATVLGVNALVRGTVIEGKGKASFDPMQVLQNLVGNQPDIERFGHYLEPLLATNTVLNPAIVYGKWKNWDGTPLDQKPLFYQGIVEQDAKCLMALSEECIEVANAITKRKKEVELSWVIPLYELFLEEYHANIGDPSTLLSVMQTNSAYDGIYHPMIPTEDGKYLPDFNCRYLTEDVPRGLAITKGIALMVDVKTPVHNQVLEWCQEKMGKEYLKGKEMKGKDIGETRCPQRFGFSSIGDLVNLS